MKTATIRIMKIAFNPTRLSLTIAGALAMSAASAHAQDVVVSGSLTDVSLGGGEFAYTLTMQNTGSEAVQSLWLGWALNSVSVFNVLNPSSGGNSLGWNSVLDGNSIQYGGTAGTALAAGGTGTFTFHSTSTPASFMTPSASGGSGLSVAYGVDASQFAIEDTTLHSFDFAPTVVSTPEPSTLGLLAMSSLGLLGTLRRKVRGH
jgi:hypothetical protein